MRKYGRIVGYVGSAIAGALLALLAAWTIQPPTRVTAPAARPVPRQSVTPEPPLVAGCTRADTEFANTIWRRLEDAGLPAMFAETEDAAADLTRGELAVYTSSDALAQYRRAGQVLPCAESQDAHTLARRFRTFVSRVDAARAPLTSERN